MNNIIKTLLTRWLYPPAAVEADKPISKAKKQRSRNINLGLLPKNRKVTVRELVGDVGINELIDELDECSFNIKEILVGWTEKDGEVLITRYRNVTPARAVLMLQKMIQDTLDYNYGETNYEE